MSKYTFNMNICQANKRNEGDCSFEVLYTDTFIRTLSLDIYNEILFERAEVVALGIFQILAM